jgi:hypothetical protein
MKRLDPSESVSWFRGTVQVWVVLTIYLVLSHTPPIYLTMVISHILIQITPKTDQHIVLMEYLQKVRWYLDPLGRWGVGR